MKKILLCVIGLSAVGCAHQPPPNDQIASSLAAVRGAEEAGAMNVPEAALHVKLAQEEIEQAKKLVANDDNQRAEDRALRAGNDAELAVAIAREDAGKKKLDQLAQAGRAAGGESAPQTQPGAQ
jgi:pyridoxal biosynthesis lyase PdxS